MNTRELNRLVIDSLLQRAVTCESLSLAELIIDTVSKLDQSIPVESIKKVLVHRWADREYINRCNLLGK